MSNTSRRHWVIASVPGLAALVVCACGGLAESRTGGDDDDDVSCPAETVGWHAVEHGKVPNDAVDGWFTVSTGDGLLSFAALYAEVAALHLDLSTGRFRFSRFAEMGRLASVGLPEYAWTGDRLLVLGTFMHGDDAENSALGGLVYQLSEDRWTAMGTEGQPTYVGCSVWTGREFLAFAPDWNGPLKTTAYDPVKDRWRKREDLTVASIVLDGCEAVWTGDTAFVWAYADEDMPDVPAVFDPEANAWRLLSKDPLVPRRYQSTMAYSDGVVLFWGGRDPDPPDPEGSGEVPPRRYLVETDTWLPVGGTGPQPNQGGVANVTAVPEGFLLQGEYVSTHGPNDFGFLYAPDEDRWFALQQGCADRENFFGDLVWTDYGAILWHDLNLNGAPVAWRYEGPLR